MTAIEEDDYLKPNASLDRRRVGSEGVEGQDRVSPDDDNDYLR